MQNSLLLLLLALPLLPQAQSDYASQIEAHRQQYAQELLAQPNPPLDSAGITQLSFFPPDAVYRITADFERSPDAKPFAMATYSGDTQPYLQYGTLSFRLQDTLLRLAAYQDLRLIRLPQYRDHLFIPFKDATNGGASYGGGRYLDISRKDIKEGKLLLDFNKAYNPYCAYSDGYACPVPPVENHLPVRIEAGERKYK